MDAARALIALEYTSGIDFKCIENPPVALLLGYIIQGYPIRLLESTLVAEYPSKGLTDMHLKKEGAVKYGTITSPPSATPPDLWPCPPSRSSGHKSGGG